VNNKQGISNIQVSVIVIVSIIGLAVLSIPSVVAKAAGIDGILSVIVSGVLTLIIASAIMVLSLRFPNDTVIEYTQIILGKLLGKAFCTLIVFYTMTISAIILRGFADAMKILLLPKTPLEFIMVSLLLVTLYQVQGGITSIAKVNEIFITPIIGAIIVVIVFSLPEVELFRYRAVFSKGLGPIIKGCSSVIFTYLGYGILAFLTPFMKDKKSLYKYGIIGVIVPIIIYTGLVFVSMGSSGSKTTADLVYPTVQLARNIVFFGTLIIRFDIFFIIFWILAVYTSLTIYMYMSTFSIVRLIGLRNYKPFALIIAPIIYLIALLPQNQIEIETFSKVANYTGLFITSSSIPILLIAVIRKKGGKANA